MNNQIDSNVLDRLRLEMLSSQESFTRAMFKAQYKRSFIVSEHHKRIFEALQDVVDGKCTRLIINMPPRYGKCCHPSTQVLTTKGLVSLRDIQPSDKLYSYKDGKVSIQTCLGKEPAYKPSVRIIMRSGRTIICSDDHPLLTPFGYVEAGELNIGSRIYAINEQLDGFYLDTVEDVQSVGYQELMHIEVSETHNFIANGLVSHNTETAIKQFISWCFALNPTCRFLHLSYSDTLVNDNSLAIRQTMMEPLYKELFPGSVLEKEKGSTDHWRTKAGGELYAVSTQGQVTGFGAGKVDEVDENADLNARDSYINNIATKFGGDPTFEAMLSALEVDSNIFQGAILIDDPLKPEDAQSEVTRERINTRFESTIRNRTNSRSTPIIIIMQRLHEHDLCGYLMEKEPDEWRVLSLPAIQTNEETGEEKPLWPVKHTLDELHKLREIEPLVFDTQYMQDPTPREGLMYENGFEEYTPDELEMYKPNQKTACNYTDTADTGADSLCSICFIDTPEYIYVTDVLFTAEPMEKTEPQTAKMLNKNKTVNARIESNNGGRGFARKIQSLLRLDYHNFRCTVHWFHQSANKYARIYNMSATTQAIVKFPKGWKQRWPKFHAALMSYRKDTARRTMHDDAPDCLTGCVEMKLKGVNQKKVKRRN